MQVDVKFKSDLIVRTKLLENKGRTFLLFYFPQCSSYHNIIPRVLFTCGHSKILCLSFMHSSLLLCRCVVLWLLLQTKKILYKFTDFDLKYANYVVMVRILHSCERAKVIRYYYTLLYALMHNALVNAIVRKNAEVNNVRTSIMYHLL